MGVNLSALIPSREIEFENLAGKSIAVDAYNTLYQFLSIIRDRLTGEPLRNSKGEITSHVSGLFYRTSKMIESGILPIYVFDGKPPEFKKHTIEERVKVREEARLKWMEAVEAGDAEKIRRYSQNATRLTSEMIDQSKELLGAMGVPCIQAPSEGEAEATHMARKGLVWAVGSQDWDSILFGAPRLVKNLTISGRRKVPRKEKYVTVKPELIEFEKVLSETGLTHDQLIILGMLVGTDYNPGGVKGIGPKTALKLVKENKTLERVLENVEWDSETEPEKIFDFFRNPPVENVEIPKARLDPEALKKILVEGHDFSEERVDPILRKLTGFEEKKKQSSLDGFFR